MDRGTVRTTGSHAVFFQAFPTVRSPDSHYFTIPSTQIRTTEPIRFECWDATSPGERSERFPNALRHRAVSRSAERGRPNERGLGRRIRLRHQGRRTPPARLRRLGAAPPGRASSVRRSWNVAVRQAAHADFPGRDERGRRPGPASGGGAIPGDASRLTDHRRLERHGTQTPHRRRRHFLYMVSLRNDNDKADGFVSRIFFGTDAEFEAEYISDIFHWDPDATVAATAPGPPPPHVRRRSLVASVIEVSLRFNAS